MIQGRIPRTLVPMLLGLSLGAVGCGSRVFQSIFVQIEYGAVPMAMPVELQLYLVDANGDFILPDAENPLLFTADELPAVIELDVLGRDPTSFMSIAGEADFDGTRGTFGWELIAYPPVSTLFDAFVAMNPAEQNCVDGIQGPYDIQPDCLDFDCDGTIYCVGGLGGVGGGSERCDNYIDPTGAGCDVVAGDCVAVDDDPTVHEGANFEDPWCAGASPDAEADCADGTDDDEDGAADCLDTGCDVACTDLGAECGTPAADCGPAGVGLRCLSDTAFAGGVCSAVCTGPASCGARAACVPIELGGVTAGMEKICHARCDPAAPACAGVTDVCRPWDTDANGARWICAPGCGGDGDCVAGETCDTTVGLCQRGSGLAVGEPCEVTSDCAGSLECFRESWLGDQLARVELTTGVCTRVGCDAGPEWACPAGSVCLDFAAASVCVPECMAAGDPCDHPDFTCTDGAAGLRCIPVGWRAPSSLTSGT